MGCRVSFPGSRHAPVVLPERASLSEHLTVQNSPVLFGCRTGICGTCLSVVRGERLPPPDEDEQEVLEVIAEGEAEARLCCQLVLLGDVEIRPLGDGGGA
jgi:ferredoxin